MSRIKICGLFRAEDGALVNEARPDYVGFIFAKSRRHIEPSLAAKIHDGLKSEIQTVGVFVDEEPRRIREICRECRLDLVQLHGHESPEILKKVKGLCGVPVIKAVHAGEALLWEDSPADYLLLDQGAGGTGISFDWAGIPPLRKPYFLAGGIGLHNIEDALELQPYALDISSGAETEGIKDGERIYNLVRLVRERSKK